MELNINPDQLCVDSSYTNFTVKIVDGVLCWYDTNDNPYEGPWIFQGCTDGYAVAGRNSSQPSSGVCQGQIDRYSYTSDNNAVQIVNASPIVSTYGSVGNRSQTHGYTDGSNTPLVTSCRSKFAFSSGSLSATSGSLFQNINGGGGITSISYDKAYLAGGFSNCFLQTYPFANDTVTCVGQIGGSGGQRGHSAGEFGYVFTSTDIRRFPFSSGLPSSSVGTLGYTGTGGSTSQSRTHGYFSNAGNATIHKYPFIGETGVTSTQVGVLTNAPISRGNGSGTSSRNYGYNAGGICAPSNPGGYSHGRIDKFSFVSDGNATSVGSLSVTKDRTAGYQV